jgi:hypothetical protein
MGMEAFKPPEGLDTGRAPDKDRRLISVPVAAECAVASPALKSAK